MNISESVITVLAWFHGTKETAFTAMVRSRYASGRLTTEPFGHIGLSGIFHTAK